MLCCQLDRDQAFSPQLQVFSGLARADTGQALSGSCREIWFQRLFSLGALADQRNSDVVVRLTECVVNLPVAAQQGVRSAFFGAAINMLAASCLIHGLQTERYRTSCHCSTGWACRAAAAAAAGNAQPSRSGPPTPAVASAHPKAAPRRFAPTYKASGSPPPSAPPNPGHLVGKLEVVDGLVPVLVPPLQDAAVQLHLCAAPADLRGRRRGSKRAQQQHVQSYAFAW